MKMNEMKSLNLLSKKVLMVQVTDLLMQVSQVT